MRINSAVLSALAIASLGWLAALPPAGAAPNQTPPDRAAQFGGRSESCDRQ